MSYDRHTRLNYCDICKKSSKEIGLFEYHKFSLGAEHGPAFHLCFECVLEGCFWCFTCQEIHTATQGCEQTTWLNHPFSQDEEITIG